MSEYCRDCERLSQDRDALSADNNRLNDRVAKLESALQSLWPGLVLDLRYADADDDKDAMQSRIDTIRECFELQNEPK